jgi:hypothetical protein
MSQRRDDFSQSVNSVSMSVARDRLRAFRTVVSLLSESQATEQASLLRGSDEA